MFKIILDMPVPEGLESATEDVEEIDQRDKHIIWKLKAQTARLTFRLFSKYSNLKFVQDSDAEKPWMDFFQKTYSETLCESHLQLMFRRKTHFVGSKTINFVIKLVTSATKIPLTMTKMLPFIDNILYETATPIMLMSSRDQ